jgi:tetratricopeptide (TPR) repeat protein
MVVAAPLPEQRDSWVGKTVMVKKAGLKISYAEGAQNVVPHPQMDYRVLAEQSGRLKVKTQYGIEGWFDKTEAVLLDEAAALFSEALRSNPKDVDIYNRRARARQLKGELDLAIEDFTEAIRLSPAAGYYSNRAGVWLAKKDYDKALADYDEALKRSPKTAAFLNNRGNVWNARKEYDKAIADYDEALRLNPKSVITHANRARSWNGKKDYDKAIADCTEALRLDPHYLPAYGQRGDAWSAKKDYDQAIADYGKVLRLDPKNVAAYVNRGKAWSAKKDYERAHADFNDALVFEPTNAGAYNVRAWLWATCPDPKFRDGRRALESAKKAVELSPKDAGFLDTLAAAHAETGNFEEAIRCQERALQSGELRDDTQARLRLEMYRKKQAYRDE